MAIYWVNRYRWQVGTEEFFQKNPGVSPETFIWEETAVYWESWTVESHPRVAPPWLRENQNDTTARTLLT